MSKRPNLPMKFQYIVIYLSVGFRICLEADSPKQKFPRWGMHLLWRCYATLSSFIYLYLFVTFVTFVTLCSPHLYISICFSCDAVISVMLLRYALLLYIYLYVLVTFVTLLRFTLSSFIYLYLFFCDAVISVTQSTRVSAFNVWSTHRPPLRPWSVADVTLTVFGLQINDTFCNYSENQSHTLCVLWFISM